MKPNRIPTFLLVSLATFLVAATSKASAVGQGQRERQDRLRCGDPGPVISGRQIQKESTHSL